jgi:hypothetical protein
MIIKLECLYSDGKKVEDNEAERKHTLEIDDWITDITWNADGNKEKSHSISHIEDKRQ